MREVFRFGDTDDYPHFDVDFREERQSNEVSLFVQDHIRLGNFAANIGLRYDHYDFLIKDDALSPGYPVPTPYDIAGSAHWRNKSDCAITVWRDLSSHVDEVEVHVQKIRFREVGRIGMCRLKYDRVSGRFIDPESDK